MNLKICHTLYLLFFASSSLLAQVIQQDDTNKKDSEPLFEKYESLFGGSLTFIGDKDTPNTQLARLNSLEPLLSINEETSIAREAHTGLVVYNTTQGNKLCPGLYMWMGSFWQQLQPPPETIETPTTVSDVGGNVYAIAQFGQAGVWMTENLRTTHTPCGHSMINSSGQSYSSMRYVYPFSNPNHTDKRKQGLDQSDFINQRAIGLLYNWLAATSNDVNTDSPNNVKTSIIQGLCPYGWHIPTDDEWLKLEEEIYNNPQLYSAYKEPFAPAVWQSAWNYADKHRGSDGIINGAIAGHGRAMISQERTASKALPSNGKSNKATGNGFDLLYAGRVLSSYMRDYGDYVSLWSSSETQDAAWGRTLYRGSSKVEREAINKRDMLSVRCKKDDPKQ